MSARHGSRHTRECRARSQAGDPGHCVCYAPPHPEGERRAFLRGVLVALAEIAEDDQETLFYRTVRLTGADDLIAEARRSKDVLALRAFKRYGYTGRWRAVDCTAARPARAS